MVRVVILDTSSGMYRVVGLVSASILTGRAGFEAKMIEKKGKGDETRT